MIEEFAHLGLLEDEEIELVPAGLALAARDRPGVDLEPCFDLLDAMAAALDDVAMALGEAPTQAQAHALRMLIAEDYGFSGDSDTYDDPANADMIAVLERRRGLPVSLAMLYADLARRAGWQCRVLDVPGHVVVRLGPDEDCLLLDPFDGGRQITASGLARLLSGMAGRPVRPEVELYPAMSNRQTLVRLLQNIASRAEAGGDRARAIEIYARMTVVAPAHGAGWWHHARLSIIAGSLAEARQSLSAMLEVTRDPQVRRQIVAMLDNLAH